MENVKTFAKDIKVENDFLIVEQGAILDNTNAVVGFGGSLSVYGTLAGATVQDQGYIGVGVNGRASWVNVQANGRFDVWANAQAIDADVNGFDLANTGNMYVLDGAKADDTDVNAFGVMFVEEGAIARDTDVNANGALHITGKAYDTDVRGGFVGVGANGVADDIDIFAGNVDVFNGGTVVEAGAGAGVMTLWSGAKAVETEITGGEVRVAEGALLLEDTEVRAGDLVFYNSGLWVGSGDIEVRTAGAINTWGQTYYNGTITVDFSGATNFAAVGAAADTLGKVRIDDLTNIFGATLQVEADSDTDNGRYLIVGNASDYMGYFINFSDGDLDYSAQIGGVGVYANDKTYSFNIDANDNLYMDVADGYVEFPYGANNSLGSGNFGAAGEQIVWTNEDKSAIGIANVGTFATAGEFAGIGDFDGNGIDDILFANGNDLNAIFNYGGGVSGTVNYKDVLAGGTVDDFQIADQGGYDTVFVKYADVFSEAVLFSFDGNMEYKFTALQNYETCIK